MLKKGPVNKGNVEAVEQLNGIYRRTLSYNNSVMLCQFDLKKKL